jgi:hypothetical protein
MRKKKVHPTEAGWTLCNFPNDQLLTYQTSL